MPAPQRPKPDSQVIASLVHGGLDRKLAEELVDVVAGFGVVTARHRSFPKGQFNPDGIEVHSVFPLEAFDALKAVLTHPRVDSVEIFPRGIVNPNEFSARIGVR